MHLPNFKVISQSMVKIQLLSVCDKKRSQNAKVGHVTPPLTPFELICIFSVLAHSPQYVHKMAL